MNFYTWMMKKHLRTQAPIGDLARDMQGDKAFPHDGSRDEIRSYLESCDACSECMYVFEKAWKKYEREGNRTEARGKGKTPRRHLSKTRFTGF